MLETAEPLATERCVTAAIRAGYAWSCREDQPKAWREVARMTGVIMRAHLPGTGPATPSELVPLLRRPLGEWLPGAATEQTLAELVILSENDELTDETFEVGCDFTTDLMPGRSDPGESWMPSWTRQIAEQVENETFKSMMAHDHRGYTAARRYLVEFPAGEQDRILEERDALGLPALTEYRGVPIERQWRGWWWPCPECRWPMRIRGGRVACQFSHHQAAYILLDLPSGRPRLQPLDGSKRPPTAAPADGSVCVDVAVWRFIVVPGVVEVRLRDRIANIAGVRADLYPNKDLHDISVEREDSSRQTTSWRVTLDVKDYSSARSLAGKLNAHPPAADYIVLPNYRRAQLGDLKGRVPKDVFDRVTTEHRIYSMIKRKLSNTGGGGK